MIVYIYIFVKSIHSYSHSFLSFYEGMGFDLVSHFLKSVQPDRVICLEPPFSQPAKSPYEASFPDPTNSSTLSSYPTTGGGGSNNSTTYSGITISIEIAAHLRAAAASGLEAAQQDIIFDIPVILGNGQQSIIKVVSVLSAEDRLVRSKFNATDMRTLSLLSYFSQCVRDPSLPIIIMMEKESSAALPAMSSSSHQQYQSSATGFITPWWRFDEPLTARTPVCVDWDENLVVSFLHGKVKKKQNMGCFPPVSQSRIIPLSSSFLKVPPSQSLYALNCTLVALVQNDMPTSNITAVSTATIPSTPNTTAIMSFTSPPLETSGFLGYGIIRSMEIRNSSSAFSINGEKDGGGGGEAGEEEPHPDSSSGVTFHVLTPLPFDQVSRANVIIRGCGMEIPVEMLVSGYEVCGKNKKVETNFPSFNIFSSCTQNSTDPLPYTSLSAPEGLGALARRSRHNLLRRKNK